MKKQFKKTVAIFLSILSVLMCTVIGASAITTDLSKMNGYTSTTFKQNYMPINGSSKVPVFMVYAKDKVPERKWTKSDVERIMFSENTKSGIAPQNSLSDNYDSLRSFLWRSSYGKLDLSGDVYEYTLKNNTSFYKEVSNIYDEILYVYRDEIDWTRYDGNNDSCVDGIYIIFMSSDNTKELSQASGVTLCGKHQITKDFDVNNIVIVRQNANLNVLAHETVHGFGVEDIYTGSFVNAAGTKASTIMNYGNNDISGALKFLFGWVTPIFVSSDKVVTLNSNSLEDGQIAVVFPNNNTDSDFVFVVEYLTARNNNNLNGVRVWKVHYRLDEHNNPIKRTDVTYLSYNRIFQFIEAVNNGSNDYLLKEGTVLNDNTTPDLKVYSDYKYAYSSINSLTKSNSNVNIKVSKMNSGAATVVISYGTTEKPQPPANNNNSSFNFIQFILNLFAKIKALFGIK